MSRTEIYFYRDDVGSLPLLLWLDQLPKKVQIKCTERISRLADLGNELRRPEADYPRTKEREIPKKEVDVAIKRKRQVAEDFKRYTFRPN